MMITLGINIGNSMIEIDKNNYLALENDTGKSLFVCLAGIFGKILMS